MSLITHKHTQQALIDRAVTDAVSQVARALQSGNAAPMPARSPAVGYYDEDGNFGRYLRCDVDTIESHKPLAP